MTASFAAPLLDELRTTNTVRVETSRGRGGPMRRTTIWIVVDDHDRVLVRSVRGGRGRWYRDLVANPTGILEVGKLRIEVLAEPAGDPDRVESCSRALATKYARAAGSLASMLRPEILDATLELRRA